MHYNIGRDEPQGMQNELEQFFRGYMEAATDVPANMADYNTLITAYRHLYDLLNKNEKEFGHNGISKNVIDVLPKLKKIAAGIWFKDQEMYRGVIGALSDVLRYYARFLEGN